jgi:hypothetical protein
MDVEGKDIYTVAESLVDETSVAEPETHHFSGAGAVTRCGSGSKRDV